MSINVLVWRGPTTLLQCCSLSLQDGGADLQPGPRVAQASEKWVNLTAITAFSKVQNADGS